MQQHKLALATQICQSRLALAVLRRFAGFKLESLAQGSVFAIYLPLVAFSSDPPHNISSRGRIV
jgi:hypothetical protein